jgi:arylsulfatase A-like enzyme
MKNRRVHPYDYAKSETTIAALLKSIGYRTVHIPGDKYFVSTSWDGYQRGFDVVDNNAYLKASDKMHTAPEVTNLAIKHLHEKTAQPLFLWVHYYDHHQPYKTPEGSKRFGMGRSDRDRYDSELFFADKHWIRLIREVEKKWPPDQYIIIFTADHGEAFDSNHPVFHHDFSIDTAVLNVPLIIQTQAQRGKQFDGLVTQLSLLPTIANIVQKKPQKDWFGESLVEALFWGKPTQASSIYSLFYIPELAKRNKPAFRQIGVRTDDFYYFVDLRSSERKLVKWKKDPLDQRNLVRKYPEKTELFQNLITRKLEYLKENERGLTRYAVKK